MAGLLLLVDIIAVLSLLPIEVFADQLRFGRVARLILLLSYWLPQYRDFLHVATKRQRLSQLVLISTFALVLTGIGASVLRFVDTTGIDIDGDGIVSTEDTHPDYRSVLWWAFRQVEDPGNLVSSTENGWLVLLSLVLTISGLFLVAVLIGIGTTLVEDLVVAGRARPVGLKNHMIVLNVDDKSQGILENITTYFDKQVRRHRIVTQGISVDHPDFMSGRQFRSFEYRSGPPANPATLTILDTDKARRVAVLSPGESQHADAEAVTSVMNIRRYNKEAWIVVELNHPSNIAAALAAGSERTIPVPARRLAALVLAQELADPGRAQMLLSLVSLEGQELYTCVLNDGRLSDTPSTIEIEESFRSLQRRIHHHNGCLLLGYFAPSDSEKSNNAHALKPIINPESQSPLGHITGLIALAPKFQPLEDAVRGLVESSLPAAPALTGYEQDIPLQPEGTIDPSHILVLGFHDDTVETVSELIQVFDDCDVTVLCGSNDERNRMRRSFLAERPRNGSAFSLVNEKLVALERSNGHQLRVHLRVGDRYADGLFRPGDHTGRIGNVFDYDALVLLTEREAPDPDAATVLAVLKLLESSLENPRLRHVVAEFRSPELAELLRERADAAKFTSLSFVCTSTLREDILNHSFFVPGLPPVLYDLLTAGQNEIWVFNPSVETGSISVDALLTAMKEHEPACIPIGYRTTDNKLIVNPKPSDLIQWAELESLYCIATPSENSLTV
jgi:hypothetical protein